MPKLERFKFFLRNSRRILTPERFALASVWVQLIAIFLTSAVIIIVFSPFVGDLPLTYKIFADPSYYSDAKGPVPIASGLILVLLGLVLFSFIISVLSAALIKLIDNIKSGSLPYKGTGHTVFINYNIKLPLILDQFNLRAKEKGSIENVVLLFSDNNIVSSFRTLLDKDRWGNLDIFIRQGNPLAFQTYEKLSITNALGIVILLPEREGDDFAADNFNLKILTTLTNNQTFFKYLSDRQGSRHPVKCSIELSNSPDSREIALELTSHGAGALFAVITPGDVIGSILARAKVDVVYYKAFFEILSFDGSTIHFVDPRRFLDKGDFGGMYYEQLLFSFEGGTLLGFSGVNKEGGFEMSLCPFGETAKSTDWMLFLTKNIKDLQYKSLTSKPLFVKNEAIIPPKEAASKKICVVGNAWPLGNIDDFMDVSSLASLEESHFVFEEPSEYFMPAFLQGLHEVDYDNIIINLDDEQGFRLTMLLVSKNRNDKSFMTKIVTILGDPVTEQLLNTNVLKSNTVLSHKLAARYIAQISFQKNLDRLFTELAFAEGAEFNLLEVGKHIPADLLVDLSELKKMLAAHKMVYIGTVDNEKNVFLEASSFSDTKQILVLSFGEIVD
ncbi:hypothetical protein [Aquiflexum gelatinilyticum]|uniref:Uncharacterized protein n=1 Tax=Aquiflexum gelatinilyticum TaxID=2961943 RepID=A0A9X2P3V3_9BACT|nr:hypothetical protein [Aquiflexum gelatinilyticum]MCR9014146.1 hypothetical protein [Aquiflexum gelatinilyticum]